MARIAGVDLPRTKRIEVGLTYIFGIGPARATGVLDASGVNPDTRVKDLTEDDVRQISRVIEEQGRVEGDLRKEISLNVKRLMVVIVVSGTGVIFQFEANELLQTHERARGHEKVRSPRRRQLNN